jgi:hypothetical protein
MILLISTEKNTGFTVALATQQAVQVIRTVDEPFKQSELLLKTIDEVRDDQRPDAIVVVKGPGDFSALRIGVSTANALAYAWDLPVAGVQLEDEWLSLDGDARLAKILKQGLIELEKLSVRKDEFVLPDYQKEPNIG